MRILVAGAAGFIGQQIVTSLRAAQHVVICAVRNLQRAKRLLPDCEIILCNFNLDTTPEIWESRLHNIDVVINCVGILQQTVNQSIIAIHEQTPRALFSACQKMGVHRIIHISALGIDMPDAQTAYAQTKKAAEDFLTQLDIDWVILRPSMVYGRGSYGGSSLFRGLAGLPWILPVLDQGKQVLQPIYNQDLAQAVVRLVEYPSLLRKILVAAGKEQLNFAEILQRMRRWLGFAPAKLISFPLKLARWGAKIFDYLGTGPINSTTMAMLFLGNTASAPDFNEFTKTIGFTPRGFSEVLQNEPGTIQDRWHARLYFLRPLLRISLGVLWLGSGLVSLLPPLTDKYALLIQVGITGSSATFLLFAAALLDIVLGILTLANWRIRLVSSLQIVTLVVYTLICTLQLPELWLYPFAPLLKNIPLLIATLMMMGIAEER